MVVLFSGRTDCVVPVAKEDRGELTAIGCDHPLLDAATEIPGNFTEKQC
jgi:hypothetical protein